MTEHTYTTTYEMRDTQNPIFDALNIEPRIKNQILCKRARLVKARHSTFWRWLFRKPHDVFTVKVEYEFAPGELRLR